MDLPHLFASLKNDRDAWLKSLQTSFDDWMISNGRNAILLAARAANAKHIGFCDVNVPIKDLRKIQNRIQRMSDFAGVDVDLFDYGDCTTLRISWE
jgi:hypothetical protein